MQRFYNIRNSNCNCIIINNSLRSCFFPRYVELNTRCSEGYRRDSSDVPKYLHNKPRPLVNHCRQRIISAVEVEPQHLKEVCNGIEDGQFQVQSQLSNTWYSLSFGAGDVMPRCSCPDFCHTGLLCKHFFLQFSTITQNGSGVHCQKNIVKTPISH